MSFFESKSFEDLESQGSWAICGKLWNCRALILKKEKLFLYMKEKMWKRTSVPKEKLLRLKRLEHFFFKRRPNGETNLQNECKNTIKINYCTYIEKRLKAPKVPKKKSKTKTTYVPKTVVKNSSMSKRKINCFCNWNKKTDFCRCEKTSICQPFVMISSVFPVILSLS